MPHYTAGNQQTFIERATADFVGQVAQRLESSGMSQAELAEKLGVTESAVSQVLNLNTVNLTFKTMVRYAHAAGMKVAAVAYDDDDQANQNGPVGSEIFNLSWQKLGKPRDIWSINEATYATREHVYLADGWRHEWMNSTLNYGFGTTGNLPNVLVPQTAERKATAYARS